MNADNTHISFIDKGDNMIRIVLVLVTLMLIIGLAVCPVMAADNSVTVDIGYRRIFESGLTIDFGAGAGYVKRQNITDFMLEFKVQTGFGW
jgi:hypothetical protein